MKNKPEKSQKPAMLYELNKDIPGKESKKQTVKISKKFIVSVVILFTMIIAAAVVFFISRTVFEYTVSGNTAVITRYKGNDTYVVIPRRILWFEVTEIGEFAFSYRDDIIGVYIPDSITVIGNSAFLWSGLTEITIPDSVVSIGHNAFSRCTGLTSLIIPGNVKMLGLGAFSYCSGLTDLTIEYGVKEIASSTFSNCYGLSKLVIPDSVSVIGSEAFMDCTGLTDIVFGSGVEFIGEQAFSGCTSLLEVTIPASVTHLEVAAFSRCSNLEKAVFEGNAPETDINSYIFNNAASGFTIYHRANATGWTNPWNGYPTSVYNTAGQD